MLASSIVVDPRKISISRASRTAASKRSSTIALINGFTSLHRATYAVITSSQLTYSRASSSSCAVQRCRSEESTLENSKKPLRVLLHQKSQRRGIILRTLRAALPRTCLAGKQDEEPRGGLSFLPPKKGKYSRDECTGYLNEEDEVLERRVEMRLLPELHHLAEVLMVDVRVNSEQSLQDGLGDRQEILGEGDTCEQRRG
ncbi:hypothetical protein X777_03948, partial [Ooceraea biroi]